MNSFFITGIPASGKSYLAGKLAKKFNLPILHIDDLRKEMVKDESLKKWVNYYWNIDELEYYTTTSCEDRWKNFVDQSEAFWPFTKNFIQEHVTRDTYILEGVSILPHLVSELGLNGVALIGESEEMIYQRIKQTPRWGETEELHKLEAQAFYHCEGKHYREEAEKYGFRVYSSAEVAEEYLIELIK